MIASTVYQAKTKESPRSRPSDHHIGQSTVTSATAISRAVEVARSPGMPLPLQVERDAAVRFGRSFSQVRIHADDRAAGAAASLKAAAFTLGNDIVFGSNRYAPASLAGELLLQHELKHVAQQRFARPAEMPELDSPGSSHEREARKILDPCVESLPLQRIQCAPDDAQYSIGGPFADSVGKRIFGDTAWPFIKAVLEGFVGGLQADVKSGRADAAKSHLAMLLVPTNAIAFHGGYLVGFVLGLVSPITDLVKGIIGAVKLGWSALEWAAKWSPPGVAASPDRQRKIAVLMDKFRDLEVQFNQSLIDFIADPKGTIQKVAGFLDSLMQLALDKARDLGAKAAHAIFDFLEKDFFSMGRGIGEVIGALVAQVLLLVFSDAIGNLVSKGASFLGKAAEFVAGKAVEVFEWIKGMASEVVSLLRNAVKGALKIFEGLANKAIEAFDALAALFAESEALEAGGEKIAAGVGRGVQGPAPNIMESRKVSSIRTSPATVSDLKPPKIHPSNLEKGASQGTKVSPLAKDAAALQYRNNLVKRFPKLQEAELGPIKRNLAEPGLFEESIYTGSGERSWIAKMRDGTPIQLDDIDQAGVVVDTKMRGLRSGLEIPPEQEPDVVTKLGGAAKGRTFAVFPEKEQAKLLKQLRFAQENGLTGVRWETNDLELFRDIARYRSTMLSAKEQKMFNVVLVER
ncbi:DUF4157 domain-containing protein [Paraburkholderia phymatum]|uniref:DUF4157 domain-containing protein n=1 Tax=Paraburkholderia phymatum TaxID=148447 RepID=A0ACC6U8R4_9BURK